MVDISGVAAAATSMKMTSTQTQAAVSVLKNVMDAQMEQASALTQIMASVSGVGANLDLSA